jgi:3',5'-cyclic AMP phosphodiesterase CpdA
MLIAHLTDLHIRPRGHAAYRVAETNMLTERALRAVAALNPAPEVMVISGDLTDNGLDEEYAVLADLLRRYVSIPVYVIPGNHDRREVLARTLGHLPGIGQDPDFVQYVVDDLPVRLVMLDSVVPGAGHGELCAQRMEFLSRALSAAPEKPTIVVLHHPPFDCGIGHMDKIRLRDGGAFGAVLSEHKQVKLVLSGHHHRPIVTLYGHAVGLIAPSVAHQVDLVLSPDAPGGFVMEPPAYMLHRWTPAGGIVSHTALVESYPGPYPVVTDPQYPGRFQE